MRKRHTRLNQLFTFFLYIYSSSALYFSLFSHFWSTSNWIGLVVWKSYTPSDSSMLTLCEGDIVEVISQAGENWGCGNLNGTIGVFPMKNVTDVRYRPTTILLLSYRAFSFSYLLLSYIILYYII